MEAQVFERVARWNWCVQADILIFHGLTRTEGLCDMTLVHKAIPLFFFFLGGGGQGNFPNMEKLVLAVYGDVREFMGTHSKLRMIEFECYQNK